MGFQTHRFKGIALAEHNLAQDCRTLDRTWAWTSWIWSSKQSKYWSLNKKEIIMKISKNIQTVILIDRT